MKNLLILILLVAVVALLGYVYLDNMETDSDKPETTLNLPDKKPGDNMKPDKVFNPELFGKLKPPVDCKAECDNTCGDKREDCEDDCNDDYSDTCEEASIQLAACNHNCQFVPFPPGPGPCWNKCEELFNTACDNDDLKDCQQDCKELNYICLEDCYGDC